MLLQAEFKLPFKLQKDPVFIYLGDIYMRVWGKALLMLSISLSALFVKRKHIDHAVLFFRTKKALPVNKLLEGKEMRI